MAQQGFLYEPHAFVDPTLGLSDPIVPHTEWLDPLTTDFGLLTQSKAMAEGIAAQAKADNVTTVYETLAPKDQAKYRDAMSGACHDGDDTGFQNANFPDGFYSLEGELVDLLDGVSSELDSRRYAYESCMASNGIKVTSRSDMFEELVLSMQPFPGPGASPQQTGAWNQWAARVETSASSDASCREGIFDAGMVLLSTQLPAWTQQHDAEIQHVVDGWNNLVQEASSYPEFGPSLAVDPPMAP